jgi:hypothetical protein
MRLVAIGSRLEGRGWREAGALMPMLMRDSRRRLAVRA